MTLSRNVRLSILTWNIYIGAELTLPLRATPKQVPKLVTKVFRQILATDFLNRATAITKQLVELYPFNR